MERSLLEIKVRLFAVYRDRIGESTLDLHLEEGTSVAQLTEQLVASYPHVFPHAKDLVVAINQEYADHSQLLSSGDEIALIPPVSGGSL